LAAEYSGASYPVSGTVYLTGDHLGSTRVVTSANGTPLARYDYAPFGEELSQGIDGRGAPYSNNSYPTATQDAVTQKFTGQERDPETGLDNYLARYFSGPQGRFTSADGAFNDQSPDDPQSWNLFSYGRNNPLNYRDPSGQDCEVNGGVAGTASNPCGGDSVTVGGGSLTDLEMWFLRSLSTINQIGNQTAQLGLDVANATKDFLGSRDWNCVAGSAVQVGAASAAGGFMLGTAAASETGPAAPLVGAGVAMQTGQAGFATGAMSGMINCAKNSGSSSGGSAGRGSSSGGKNGWTNKIARQKASQLGFKEVKGSLSHGQLKFKSGNRLISPDVDGHTGYQSWKVFDSSGNRLGTFNTDLTVKLGK
jgi:RHS repeat-associated protein